jgi:hypothetical protein
MLCKNEQTVELFSLNVFKTCILFIFSIDSEEECSRTSTSDEDEEEEEIAKDESERKKLNL